MSAPGCSAPPRSRAPDHGAPARCSTTAQAAGGPKEVVGRPARWRRSATPAVAAITRARSTREWIGPRPCAARSRAVEADDEALGRPPVAPRQRGVVGAEDRRLGGGRRTRAARAGEFADLDRPLPVVAQHGEIVGAADRPVPGTTVVAPGRPSRRARRSSSSPARSTSRCATPTKSRSPAKITPSAGRWT